ncbi:lysophospholipid acyltransferase family protein [Micromonospora zamorensis]|uniref:lysophospholipid acyltransferase family protein n=1 Tax=Micromonospora zamorensis TaxID=709883 RepID=UPI003D97E746
MSWLPVGLINDIRQLSRGRDLLGQARTPRSAVAHESDRSRRFPIGWARTNTAVAARQAIQLGVLKPFTWSQVAADVQGLDHLEQLNGPVVIVANHSSHLDTPLILGSLPPRLRARLAVGAAADYFFDARWRALVTALVFNAFPVERRGSKRRRSLAPQLLAEGWNMLLFPEGTRSEDGWMSPPRLGPAHLCVLHGAPMVPVILRGTYAAMPRSRNWPVPGRPRVIVRYGKPLYPAADESARDLHGRMVQAFARLWAEDELNWYGSLRAEARGELSLPAGPLEPSPGGGVDGRSRTVVPEGSWRRVWESSRLMPRRDRARVWRSGSS